MIDSDVYYICLVLRLREDHIEGTLNQDVYTIFILFYYLKNERLVTGEAHFHQ